MDFFLLCAVVSMLLAPISYQHYQKANPEPPQPKGKKVLQSDKCKAKQAAKPSKQKLKPSRPIPELPTTGIHMVAGKAVLIKSSTPPVETPAQKTVLPPPPPPSVHSKLNPVKPAPFDVPAQVLTKLDRYTYDRAISTRLVMNVANKNPGKDGAWCAEKALWDIERDRQ